MSRKTKKHYNSFSRVILSEFISEKELNKLDKKYTQAKIVRMLKQFLAVK